MKCTCFKRRYPCEIHGDKHLPQIAHQNETTIVIHIICHWAEGSTNPDDRRWGYTRTRDSIQEFDSGPLYKTRQDCLDDIRMGER